MSAVTLSFADRLNALTFQNKISGIRLGDPARGILTKYRMRLRDAERFTIDNEAVRLICQLSYQRDRMAAWSCLARLPYDTVWFEFNLHEKCREFERMGTLSSPFDPDEVGATVGYLMYRDGPPGTTRWIAHPFYEMHTGEMVSGLIAFLFDPEGQPNAPLRGSEIWQSPTLSLRPGFPKARGEYPYGSIITIDQEALLAGDFNYDGSSVVAGDWFINRGGAIVDPFWEKQLARQGNDKINQMIAPQVKEEAGIVRWLVTLLTAINTLPKDIRSVPTTTKTRVVAGRRLKPLSHNTIAIKLPRDDRVVRARAIMDHAVSADPRPWHKVIGHWRVIERSKAHGRVCRHLPTMVESGVAICERCELMVRWISDYHRGDMKVGIVEHTYAVTAG
jgi:hypothetical protein